ncbi:hypothetical protein AB0D83_20455 [Streptomyces decoyicus]|uniref:hypothetical protein n=1 Tax=Streptomyces decoyicus TaxID=249567 RepID=UPI0033C328BF
MATQPRGGSLLVGRHAGAVEREDRVMSDDGAQATYQSSISGELTQATACVLEGSDALSPARFSVRSTAGVRVHQTPHS